MIVLTGETNAGKVELIQKLNERNICHPVPVIWTYMGEEIAEEDLNTEMNKEIGYLYSKPGAWSKLNQQGRFDFTWSAENGSFRFGIIKNTLGAGGHRQITILEPEEIWRVKELADVTLVYLKTPWVDRMLKNWPSEEDGQVALPFDGFVEEAFRSFHEDIKYKHLIAEADIVLMNDDDATPAQLADGFQAAMEEYKESDKVGLRTNLRYMV